MSKSSETRKAKAVALVKKHVDKSGRILEVSCGRGAELSQLQDAGYEVTGTNFTKYEGVIPNVNIDNGVDILRGLPYDNSSFDCVILLDVIEHLSDHDRAVSELSRVCTDNGHVIVMTPNANKLASRLHFLFTGFVKSKRAFIGYDVPHKSAFAFHNYPPHLPIFLYQLASHGLRQVEFTASVYKAKSFILYPIFMPFIWLATAWNIEHGEKYLKGSGVAKDLHSCLTSVDGLCGEFWFIVAQKKSEHVAVKTRLPQWSERWEKDDGACE